VGQDLLTDVGPVEVKVPRDRDGTFEPKIIKKRQKRLTGVVGAPPACGGETVWPKTIVQTCVVHLLRNSFRYADRQDRDKTAKVLKPVSPPHAGDTPTAPTEEAALERFTEFADAWGTK